MSTELRQAAYSSPTGQRVAFDFEDVSVNFDKKTSGHNCPDVDGTLVQDLGHTGRKYPLRLYLWGKDHDKQAEALEAAIKERGIGKLEHPKYGTVDVVPYGTVTRRDDLKTAGDQAVFEVTFWETLNLVYPSAQADPAAEVAAAISDFNGSFELSTVSSAVGLASFGATFEHYVGVVVDVLGGIADGSEKVSRQFNRIVDALQNNVLDPLVLASQTLQMLQAPARSNAGGRQSAYGSISEKITTRTPDPDRYEAQALFATGAVSGSIITLINTQYTTKREALDAAEVLLDQFADVVAWQDDNNPRIDTGESYQALQKAVALTAGYLVDISFSLKMERYIVLDRCRAIVDLSAELYGKVDEKLDFLIQSNDLTGDEILELPRGRKIAYYI